MTKMREVAICDRKWPPDSMTALREIAGRGVQSLVGVNLAYVHVSKYRNFHNAHATFHLDTN